MIRARFAVFPWLVAAAVALGVVMRAYQYYEFPVGGETRDEYAWSLLGGSLLQTGTPASWSFFSVYPAWRSIDVGGGNDFPLVRPTLDHPPLFALLPGAAITLAGKAWDQLPSMKVVRLPLVILGSINLALAAWWFWRVFDDHRSAFVATLLFATIPSFVFLSRAVVSENLLLTWLLAILLLSTFTLKRQALWQFLAHLVLPFTKVAGFALAVGTVLAARASKQKWWCWAIDGAIAGVVLFLIYAALYDFSLFLKVQQAQGSRDIGFLTLYITQLWTPTLVAKWFPDGFTLLGYIAGFAWIFTRYSPQKANLTENMIAHVFLTSLLFLAISVGEHTVHGWYRIVFWPIWIYCLVDLFQRAATAQNWLALALAWLLMAPPIRLGLLPILGFSHYGDWSTWVRLLVVISGLHLLVPQFATSRQAAILWRGSVILLVALLVIANSFTVFTMTPERYWQDDFYVQSGLRP